LLSVDDVSSVVVSVNDAADDLGVIGVVGVVFVDSIVDVRMFCGVDSEDVDNENDVEVSVVDEKFGETSVGNTDEKEVSTNDVDDSSPDDTEFVYAYVVGDVASEYGIVVVVEELPIAYDKN
jgi:hypothetical protein